MNFQHPKIYFVSSSEKEVMIRIYEYTPNQSVSK
jgi:hypothetical protein